MAAPRGLVALLCCVAICGVALVVDGRKTAFDGGMSQADLNAIEILERVRGSLRQRSVLLTLPAMRCCPLESAATCCCASMVASAMDAVSIKRTLLPLRDQRRDRSDLDLQTWEY